MFRTHFSESGVKWDTVELHLGEKIPNLEPYDALWVKGGPMDVWDDAKYPWLTDEKDAIRILPCNLTFHIMCIDRWFCERNTCPTCRDELI